MRKEWLQSAVLGPGEFIAAAKDKPAAGQAHAGHVDGKAVYDKVCFACHLQSVAGSPKLGDYHVGDRVAMLCVDGVVTQFARVS